MILLLSTTLLLAQAEPAPEGTPAPPPAAAPAPTPSPPGEPRRHVEKMGISPDDPARAAEAQKIADTIKKHTPIAAPVIPEVKDYSMLPEAEQVKYSAREFFTQLIAGDARNITNNCALPFQLEDRRLQSPDELFQEWLRNLRAKRTDLLTLYDIEVLAPADMEKKYGKPPQRLASMPWRGPKTYVAVANLSGHAAIAVFRHTGASWAVVGYAD